MSAQEERTHDTLSIHDLLYAYADSIDQQEFEGLRALFTPDATIDYRQTGGPMAPLTEIVAFLGHEMARYRRLQHFISNPRVHFDPTSPELARARSYVLAQHGYKVEGQMHFFQLGGVYEDELLRTDAGWRITSRVLRLRWLDGELPQAVV